LIPGGGRIGFLTGSEEEIALDYGRRLGRLRWRRCFPDRRAGELRGGRPASKTFAYGEDWLVVRDEIAIPLPGGGFDAVAGVVVVASARSPADPPVVHTLAELERARIPSAEYPAAPMVDPPAIGFRVGDFPPAAGETVRDYVGRLLSPELPRRFAARFAAVVFDPPTGGRPDVVRHFREPIRRLLDVGCGTGEASAALRRTSPGASITGIERDGASVDRARGRLDRVVTGDAAQALRRLAEEGERFDAFLFADVLEHLEDPIGALTLARGLALPGATLVASVPNVGHLSLVRDLVAGRFDPLPAGLADAGHLRWFTRRSLEEALEEAGWHALEITALPGAPAPDAPAFLGRAASFPELDRDALAAYQWVAVAEPAPESQVADPR
jgi:2-polyprenyl-3-methyl-5-hydroxy-6-metoxy-1,4-benzoquinol methylase